MCEQIGNAIIIALIGFLLIPSGSYLVWWNEANRVCTGEAYEDAEMFLSENEVRTSISVTAPTNGGFLDGCDPTDVRGEFTHLECPVDDSLQTVDESTGIVAQGAYKMVLESEMYSYSRSSETQKNSEDKKESCSCYNVGWTISPVTSINRKQCEKCKISSDIDLPPVPSGSGPVGDLDTFIRYAPSVSLGNGAFVIGQNQISKIAFQPQIPAPQLPNVTSTGDFHHVDAFRCSGQGNSDGLTECWYYTNPTQTSSSSSCSAPNSCLGDKRITVTTYGSENLSVLGRPSTTGDPPVILMPEPFGGSIIPPCDKRSIFYVSDGLKSSDILFDELENSLAFLTMILRVVSAIVIVLGFYMTFYPLEAIVDVIPLVGDFLSPMVGGLLFIFAMIAGLSVWSLSFSAAWVFYRPVIGIPLFLLALLSGFGAVMIQRHTKNSASKYNNINEINEGGKYGEVDPT